MANVINKVKEQSGRVAEDHRRKRVEKRLNKLERQLYLEQQEQAKLEAEKRAIEEERDRLIQLDQHEIMAEAIMAIRGFYAEFQEVREAISELEAEIEDLEAEISAIRHSQSDDDEDD